MKAPFVRSAILAVAICAAVQGVMAEPTPLESKVMAARAQMGGPAADEGRKVLESVVAETTPTSPQWGDAAAVHQAAGAALDLKMLDKAKELNARTLELEPTNPRYLSFKARMAMEAGDMAGAEAASAAAIAAGPRDVYALRVAAMLEVKKNRMDQAEALFATLNEVDPKDPWALEYLGEIASARGNWEAAAKHFEASLAAGSKWPGIHYNLGQCYQKLNRDKDAKREYELQLAATPKDRKTLEKMVEACASNGDTDGRAKYEAILKELPPAAGKSAPSK